VNIQFGKYDQSYGAGVFNARGADVERGLRPFPRGLVFPPAG